MERELEGTSLVELGIASSDTQGQLVGVIAERDGFYTPGLIED